jgi:hypothetical protein
MTGFLGTSACCALRNYFEFLCFYFMKQNLQSSMEKFLDWGCSRRSEHREWIRQRLSVSPFRSPLEQVCDFLAGILRMPSDGAKMKIHSPLEPLGSRTGAAMLWHDE